MPFAQTLCLFFGLLLTLSGSNLFAADQGPEVLQVVPKGGSLADVRLAPPKDLDGYFPFTVPESVEQWEVRAKELRQRILVSNGLYPMPEKTPLNVVMHGKVQRDGFTVEKVYFESHPGFYVTGLLFRPEGKGPFPGVLCPHGHGGRLMDVGLEGVKKQIENGEEKNEESGRMPNLTRCATLARMGCVVFIHDMLGYADSIQLSDDLAHRYGKIRPHMEGTENWGLYSAQAELRLQSIMGLQTWNCIRALDFLCDLPDVDASRIGVTGGSGGGTQTILTCAIDERPVVAFPQGMVSTSMQGGCTCENTSLMRIGTGNVELCALFAPKPQGMTAANDWTKDMMTLGYPELKQLYKMYGHQENVECEAFLHFPHNYNYVTRAMMYPLFNQHLKLGLEEPIIEKDFKLLTETEYSVWNAEHPAPAEQGEAFEIKLVKHLTESSQAQMSAMPADQRLEMQQNAINVIIGRTLKTVGTIERTKVEKLDRGDHWLFKDLVAAKDHGEQVAVLSIYPKGVEWSGRVLIWATGKGKAGLFTDDGKLLPEIRPVLDRGDAIITADLFAQGEIANADLPSDLNRVVKNPREFAGYTYTYNNPLFAQRVHDVLTLIAWARNGEHPVKNITLIGTDGAGPIIAAAGAVSGDQVQGLALEQNDYQFKSITDYKHENFLPGIVKYGDMAGLLELNQSENQFGIAQAGSTKKIVQWLSE